MRAAVLFLFLSGCSRGTPAIEAQIWKAKLNCGNSAAMVSDEISVEVAWRCVKANRCATSNGLDPRTFAQSTGGADASNWRAGRAAHPLNWVTQDEAKAVCRGLGGQLPTLAEYRCIAFGNDARSYPWGEQAPDPSRLNYGDRDFFLRMQSLAGVGDEMRQVLSQKFGADAFSLSDGATRSAAVGSFVAGNTPDGIADVFGNVEEWTRDDPTPDGLSLIVGGSYATPLPAFHPRMLGEVRGLPTAGAETVGFRCVKTAAAN
jgi:formylglycine-generating enzyme required for sulfatase activity